MSTLRTISVTISDSEILAAFHAGAREQATTLLVRKYQKMVFATALRYVRSDDDALDISQEVFIKAIEKIRSFREESALSTWLYRIVVNECMAVLRKRKLRSFFGLETITDTYRDMSATPDEQTQHDDLHDKLWYAIAQLPEKQRETFCLRYFDGLSYEEISAMLGTSTGGLKANYFQAIQKLTTLLRGVMPREMQQHSDNN